MSEGPPMFRRRIAQIATLLLILLVLIWTRHDEEQPVLKLPKALGAIQPRLSPDGSTLAVSYQGEIWTSPRTGGTMTLLTPSEGADVEPAWSPDGKRIAFVRAGAVKVVQFPDGKEVPLPKALATGGTYAVDRLEFSADGKRLLGA